MEDNFDPKDKQELLRRMKDPLFYLSHFTKIKGKEAGAPIPFVFNEAQKDLANTLRNNSRVICLKARQLGFSTAVVGLFYHRTIMTPGTTTVLIAYNTELAAELLDKVKTFWRSTPPELRPTIYYNSRYEISFPVLDSKIIVLASTDNVGRGYTIHNCLCTEVSSWDGAEEKMAILEASVPIEGKIVCESCVTGDTLVFTDEGIKTVADVHPWSIHPEGFSEGREILIDGHYGPKPTTTYYNSGVRKGFRITTKLGHSVGMSSVHKMMTYDPSEVAFKFKEAKDLELGDLICTKVGSELWGHDDELSGFIPTPYKQWWSSHYEFHPTVMVPDLAYLLGQILGDGYIDFKQKRVVVTTVDEPTAKFLTSEPLGLKFKQSKGQDKYHYILKNKSFVEFLEWFGFKPGKAPTKTIPPKMLSCSRENVRAFVQGLFDSDGSSHKTRGNVSFVSTSKKLVNTLQTVLLNFGVSTRKYSYVSEPTDRVKVRSFGWTLETNRYYGKIFGDKIGFRLERKQNNLTRIGVSPEIPGVGTYVARHLKDLGITQASTHFSAKSLYSEKGLMTYDTLKKVIRASRKDSVALAPLVELCSKGYIFDPVISKEPIEENVYDFTVEDGHTVTYNGLVGHQTPKGQGNWFHRTCFPDKNTGWIKREYGWWWGYTREQIETIRSRMNDPMLFAQEYELAFLATGRPIFDQMLIQANRNRVLKVGDKVKLADGTEFTVYEQDGWRFYRPPEKGGLYVCGADVAEGLIGGDFSDAVIFDRRNGEEVARYNGVIAPDLFGKVLNDMGRRYNNAYMTVEINNHGLTTVTALRNLTYPMLYFRPASFDTPGTGSTDRIGWKTTRLTRPLMIDDMKKMWREGLIQIRSVECLNEMSTFVYDDDGNMITPKGFHDDRIFSTAIAIQAFKQMAPHELKQLDFTQHMPSAGY